MVTGIAAVRFFDDDKRCVHPSAASKKVIEDVDKFRMQGNSTVTISVLKNDLIHLLSHLDCVNPFVSSRSLLDERTDEENVAETAVQCIEIPQKSYFPNFPTIQAFTADKRGEGKIHDTQASIQTRNLARQVLGIAIEMLFESSVHDSSAAMHEIGAAINEDDNSSFLSTLRRESQLELDDLRTTLAEATHKFSALAKQRKEILKESALPIFYEKVDIRLGRKNSLDRSLRDEKYLSIVSKRPRNRQLGFDHGIQQEIIRARNHILGKIAEVHSETRRDIHNKLRDSGHFLNNRINDLEVTVSNDLCKLQDLVTSEGTLTRSLADNWLSSIANNQASQAYATREFLSKQVESQRFLSEKLSIEIINRNASNIEDAKSKYRKHSIRKEILHAIAGPAEKLLDNLF